MEYYLHTKQSVLVKGSFTSFRHYTQRNVIQQVTLDWRQLQNLNDILHDLKILKEMKYYPIGDSLWLIYDYPVIKLMNYTTQTYFNFYKKSWTEYIRRVHRKIYSLARDGQRQRSYCEYDADDESEFTHQLGRGASQLQKHYQILSRSARNGCNANEQRSKFANVSWRKSANSRRSLPIRGGKNASRIRREIKEDKEDGECSSQSTDNFEYGSEITLEEADLPTEDSRR